MVKNKKCPKIFLDIVLKIIISKKKKISLGQNVFVFEGEGE